MDSYQGREKEIIIYSIVADRYHKALDNYARFNVAASRAKRKLIILSSLVHDIDQYLLARRPTKEGNANRVAPRPNAQMGGGDRGDRRYAVHLSVLRILTPLKLAVDLPLFASRGVVEVV